LADGDDPDFWKSVTNNEHHTGISHLHRSVSLKQVTDGVSKTYLVGEKALSPGNYESGLSIGDDDNLYSGFANDNHRFAASRAAGPAGWDQKTILYYPPAVDSDDPLDPARHIRFGSAHHARFHMVMCDGSVESIAYDVDPVAHYFGAHRGDAGVLAE
ncbi:MAG: DUF1559 domain-containing protein, partial [Planctomycetales bacterium]|nr:DUF1559 domain-containing protein [Planctomycetales bacterium]